MGRVQALYEKGMEIRRTELSPHVNLIESRQHCTCVLGLLQTLSDALSHPVHFLLKEKVGQVLTIGSQIEQSPFSPREHPLVRSAWSRTTDT